MDAPHGRELNVVGKKLDGNYTKNVASFIEQVLEATPHKTAAVWPPTSHHENHQVRRTRYVGHFWRSKDELISDILQWTLAYGRAKVGRPARTYIQQFCADTGCSLEDLWEAMDDRDEWWERVREIRAGSATGWWWWWWLHMQINTGCKRVWSTVLRFCAHTLKLAMSLRILQFCLS